MPKRASADDTQGGNKKPKDEKNQGKEIPPGWSPDEPDLDPE